MCAKLQDRVAPQHKKDTGPCGFCEARETKEFISKAAFFRLFGGGFGDVWDVGATPALG